jgi:hypothetical protein
MEKGIFGKVYEKKRSFIENLVKDVDSRIGVQNYSNEALKSFVESNYKVSFNFKIGKKYINGNDFEDIATSYRNNKRTEAYKEVTSMINDVKEKKRQEAYEEIRSFLTDLKEKKKQEEYDNLREMIKETVEIDKGNRELYKKLDVYNVADINAMLGFNNQKIVEEYGFVSKDVYEEYINSFRISLKKGNYAKAYELNESMFNKIDAKKIEIAKEKIKKGEELSFDEALMLSKNKALVLSYNGKVEAIEKYLAIHPNVVSENIAPYQTLKLARNYKKKDAEPSTGLTRVLIKNNDLEGHLLGIDTQGAIREGGDIKPENFVNSLVLDVKEIYKNGVGAMKFSEMISQTINTAAGSNIKDLGNYNYFLLK